MFFQNQTLAIFFSEFVRLFNLQVKHGLIGELVENEVHTAESVDLREEHTVQRPWNKTAGPALYQNKQN
jgi:hypothetical protein